MPAPLYERILLFTGGLDSVIAWHLLDKPAALYIELGSKEQSQGRRDALRAAGGIGMPELNITQAPWWFAGLHHDGHIPLRNLHLVTVGALKSDRVVLGAVKGESSPDKSDAFLRAAGHAISQASQGRHVRIEAPLKGATKRQQVATLIELVGITRAKTIITSTRSCYDRTEERCGRCMACFRRWVALSLNGIEEDHSRPPWQMKMPGRKEQAVYLRHAPVTEWPGILQSNRDAWLALRRRRSVSAG